ncbi:MAG: acetate/propionate family kinase [Pseudomonadota bacterium]
MDECVLVLNAGSSSLKFATYGLPRAGRWQLSCRGQIQGIGSTANMWAHDGAGVTLIDRSLGSDVCNAAAALHHLSAWLREFLGGTRLLGVGHRVVHGGSQFAGPTLVEPQMLAQLRKLEPLAPLHQPYNLAAIDAVHHTLPDVPQVACFDTSFHRGQSAVAQLVPLPREIRGAEVQRYGFHGLSYEYIAGVLPQVAPTIAAGRVIVAHLGNGASLCALQAGRSIDHTLGFTALDGLCMGTRAGTIDPGVVLYLFQALGLSASQVETMLYTKSGLLGISGISNDMRVLLESSEADARLAVDYFVYQAVRQIGAMAAVLGGIDALVFTAGIGENSSAIRQRICEASAWLGLQLDGAANQRGETCISSKASHVAALVIPTNEELMIARHTGKLLGLNGVSS